MMNIFYSTPLLVIVCGMVAIISNYTRGHAQHSVPENCLLER